MMNQIIHKEFLKIIQITDTHLFSKADNTIYGVKSNLKFLEVIHHLLINDAHDTDMIILTGDISQQETTQSYQLIANSLTNLSIPIYWIPGNHDNIDKMKTIFNNTINFYQSRQLSLKHWHIIFLNTKLDNSDEGFLSEDELLTLENEIKLAPKNKLITIIMHHHPIEVMTPLIDQYILSNRDEFWNLILKHKISLIICGHVHGDYSLKFQNVSIETSPATCLQWKKGAKELNFDYRIGYKTYYLYMDCYKTETKLW